VCTNDKRKEEKKTEEKILTEDQGMRKVSVKMASRISSHDQKQHGQTHTHTHTHTLSLSLSLSIYIYIYIYISLLAEEKHSLDSVITCGYSWSFHYETEMKYPACNKDISVTKTKNVHVISPSTDNAIITRALFASSFLNKVK
jgi:hypothetical protein